MFLKGRACYNELQNGEITMDFSEVLIYIFGFLGALIIMLVVMPGFIRYLHKIKFGQTEREEGLQSHKVKNGTPTMGGIAFILVPFFYMG